MQQGKHPGRRDTIDRAIPVGPPGRGRAVEVAVLGLDQRHARVEPIDVVLIAVQRIETIDRRHRSGGRDLDDRAGPVAAAIFGRAIKVAVIGQQGGIRRVLTLAALRRKTVQQGERAGGRDRKKASSPVEAGGERRAVIVPVRPHHQTVGIHTLAVGEGMQGVERAPGGELEDGAVARALCIGGDGPAVIGRAEQAAVRREDHVFERVTPFAVGVGEIVQVRQYAGGREAEDVAVAGEAPSEARSAVEARAVEGAVRVADQRGGRFLAIRAVEGVQRGQRSGRRQFKHGAIPIRPEAAGQAVDVAAGVQDHFGGRIGTIRAAREAVQSRQRGGVLGASGRTKREDGDGGKRKGSEEGAFHGIGGGQRQEK